MGRLRAMLNACGANKICGTLEAEEVDPRDVRQALAYLRDELDAIEAAFNRRLRA